MSLTMYAASVTVFKQNLAALSGVLAKAEAHATARKIDPAALLHARLYPDMFTLIRQVQLSCDFARRCVARLAGLEPPSVVDHEQSFADLQARIASTLAYMDGLTPAQFEGSEAREMKIPSGPDRTLEFTGQNYLLQFALPNYFFHSTTAYDILRHNGVELGKRDFVGG
jgi:hypothetical protein